MKAITFSAFVQVISLTEKIKTHEVLEIVLDEYLELHEPKRYSEELFYLYSESR
jgi:hypothetical protein